MSKISRSLVVVASIAAAGLASSAHAAVFNFPNFPSSSNLNLVGQATVAGNALVLNPIAGSSKGAAWYSGGKVEVSGGFTTRFTFQISNQNRIGADGFAFVIQNTSPTAIGAVGGGIGYAANPIYDPAGGITNSFAVEFDTWNNVDQWDDMAAPRSVSFQTNGLGANNPDAAFSRGASPINGITDGAPHVADINYNSGVMTVSVDGVQVLSAPIDLSTLLALDTGTAWVGFTAATGGASAAESHQINDWSFNSTIPTPGAAALAAMGGALLLRRRRD